MQNQAKQQRPMTAQVHEAAFSFDRLFGIEMQNAVNATVNVIEDYLKMNRLCPGDFESFRKITRIMPFW